MAKRYYQSKRDRMDERAGEARSMAKKEYKKAGRDWAMYKENEYKMHEKPDMLHEDHSAPFNMPQQAFMKYYGNTEHVNEYLNDGISGIDSTIDGQVRKMKSQLANSKG